MAIQNINFNVDGQKIKYSTLTRIVANSANVVTATFTFTQEWTGYAKKAIFSIGSLAKTQILTGNTVQIPSECLINGTLYISVVGIIDEPYSRITTERMMGIPVIMSGALEGDAANVITPTEGEQVVLLAQSAVDTANGIDAKAQSALDIASQSLEDVNTPAPEFNTATLTALSQIATVTDSYSGVADFSVDGNTLQQVVTNGDFADVRRGGVSMVRCYQLPVKF